MTRTDEKDQIARDAEREQRADVDAALVHARALTTIVERMMARNKRTAIALGMMPGGYFGHVIGICAVAGRMIRVYSPEVLRAVEVMLRQIDRRENGE